MTPNITGGVPIASAPGPRAYPVSEHESDPRFCFGLVAEVAAVLRAHGYPEPKPGDLGALLLSLFRFLYRSEADK